MDQAVIEQFNKELKGLRDDVSKAVGSESERNERHNKMHTQIEALEKKLEGMLSVEQAEKNTKAAMEELAERMGKSMSELEAGFKRISTMTDADKKEAQLTIHQKAFRNALLKGHTIKEIKEGAVHGYDTDAVKALTVGQDLAGGYLAPPEFVRQIIEQNVVEYSNIRQFATVRTTTSQSIIFPTKQRAGGAFWVAEVGTRPTSPSLQLGAEEIRTAEMGCMVGISRQDMEDPVIDVEALVRADIGESMALLENIEFLTGDGINKPEGMLTNGNTNVVNSGDANTITADSMIAITESLKEVYLSDARFLANRNTLRVIRTMKDGEGRYIWQNGLTEGRPNTILGYAYTQAQHMPDIAAGATPILFGSIKRGYVIVDRLNMSILVDPYTLATQGIVVLHARKRVGGGVIVPEALSKISIAA